MNTNRTTPFFCMLMSAALAMTLTACSSEPSEAEMKEAIQQHIMGSMGPLGASLVVSVEIKKIGCESAKQGYLCDFEGHIETPMFTNNGKDKGLFVKGDQGWTVIEK